MRKLLLAVLALTLLPAATAAQCRGGGTSGGSSSALRYTSFVTESCGEYSHLAAVVVVRTSDPRWGAPFPSSMRPAEEEFNEWRKVIEGLPQFDGLLFGGTTNPNGALMVGWDHQSRRLTVLRSLELGDFDVILDRELGVRDGSVTTVVVEGADLLGAVTVQVDSHRPADGTSLYHKRACMTAPRPAECRTHEAVQRLMAGWPGFELAFGRSR